MQLFIAYKNYKKLQYVIEVVHCKEIKLLKTDILKVSFTESHNVYKSSYICIHMYEMKILIIKGKH